MNINCSKEALIERVNKLAEGVQTRGIHSPRGNLDWIEARRIEARRIEAIVDHAFKTVREGM